MPWPHMPRGREPIDPTAPMKAFSINESHLDSIDQSRSLQINTIQPDKSNDGKGIKVKILDQENFMMKNCLENDEAIPKYLKQNKKHASILEIITLLQNQPNDTGQYFY